MKTMGFAREVHVNALLATGGTTAKKVSLKKRKSGRSDINFLSEYFLPN